MNEYEPYAGVVDELAAAGLPREEAYDWLTAQPAGLTDFATDCRTFCKFWEKTSRLLARLRRRGAASKATVRRPVYSKDSARLANRVFAAACGNVQRRTDSQSFPIFADRTAR